MLHAYIQIFNMTGNLENFLQLNVASFAATDCGEVFGRLTCGSAATRRNLGVVQHGQEPNILSCCLWKK
jgi:hypothetical protein